MCSGGLVLLDPWCNRRREHHTFPDWDCRQYSWNRCSGSSRPLQMHHSTPTMVRRRGREGQRLPVFQFPIPEMTFYKRPFQTLRQLNAPQVHLISLLTWLAPLLRNYPCPIRHTASTQPDYFFVNKRSCCCLPHSVDFWSLTRTTSPEVKKLSKIRQPVLLHV